MSKKPPPPKKNKKTPSKSPHLNNVSMSANKQSKQRKLKPRGKSETIKKNITKKETDAETVIKMVFLKNRIIWRGCIKLFLCKARLYLFV